MTHLEPALDPPADRLVARLDELLDELAGEVADCTPVSDAVRIDRIARLEKLRAVTAALQLAETVRFGQSQTAAQLARKVHPREIGAGIADQIGLACGLSAFQGGRRLGAARALWFDLPQTFAALTAGDLSERVAEAVVHETRHLEHDLRQQVDAQVITAGITEMGLWAATACAKKYAYEADRAGYVERGRTERKQRRVTLRPAPDTMSFLTGHLPVEQGVACLAALKLHTDARKAVGDARTRGQIMADTLVERITGQAAAADVNVEVQIILPAELLTDPASNRTAIVHGYGPIPGQPGHADHRRQPGPEDLARDRHPPAVGVARPSRRSPSRRASWRRGSSISSASHDGRRRETSPGSASGYAGSPGNSPS